ncbi:unnamed protein product [Cladocopium goreaui]|nr:unnamed protein product [Cladocopium goreaui]
MPLDGMTMPMAMQPNLNNPCLLRQLRMPMQSQMVSKAPMTSMTWEASEATCHGTWQPSEDTLPPLDSGRSELRSSLVQDGDEFMMLLDSLEERVELMSKMQETRKRLQEVREPKKEPEAIEDGGYQGYRGSDHLDEQEESGAQLLLDQLQHLSPTSDAPRWCRPDLLQQDAQPAAGNGEADAMDGISAADFRKLVTELERHLQESARLREDLQMEREESARLRQKHQQAVQDWMHEKAIFQNQINEMQKRLEKMAKSTSSGSSPGGESGSSGVVRICTLRDMSTDPLPNQAATNLAVEGFSLCGSNIAMSEDRMVATRSRGSRQSMVLGSAPIQKISAGWYYEVRVCEVESRGMSYGSVGGLGIGVTKQSASQSIRIPDKAFPPFSPPWVTVGHGTARQLSDLCFIRVEEVEDLKGEEYPEFVQGRHSENRKALTVKDGISSSAVDFLRMTQEYSSSATGHPRGQDEEALICEVLASNALFRHCDALLPYAAAPKAPRINLKPKEAWLCVAVRGLTLEIFDYRCKWVTALWSSSAPARNSTKCAERPTSNGRASDNLVHQEIPVTHFTYYFGRATCGQVLNTVGFLGIADEAEPFKPSGLEANQLPVLKGGAGRTTGGAYEIYRGQAPSSLFAERRGDAEIRDGFASNALTISPESGYPTPRFSGAFQVLSDGQPWNINDPVLLVRDSFKRYLEAALLHLSDLQRRWPSESTSQRWQVEELTNLCKECGLASAKAVVACERVLKSRWNAQVQLEAEELARGVPMPGFAKLQPRVPSKGEKRVKSSQSPHQRWRALKKGAKPLAIQDVAARSQTALMPQPSPDEQMERRRFHAAVRLQRAVRRYVQRLRLRQRQAAAEAGR